jgi:hypothetical protein
MGASVAGMIGAVGGAANALDARDFNAVGDGKTDNTAALQKALDKAAQTRGSVFIPDGVYLCSTLKIPPFVGLCGNPCWSYNEYAGPTLQLGDASAKCLLDVTGAYGFRINGLGLNGGSLGKNVHGILLDKPDYGKHEHCLCLERCRIGNFSGDGIHLSRIWVFSIRHCMICFNGANGLRYRGWDGFVMDNWFSANVEAGIGAYEENASVTFTANRIEWNHRHGIILNGGEHYNITGNYFDRAGGPAIALVPRGEHRCKSITVTGNIISRNGGPFGRPFSDQYQSSHLRFEEVEGLTCVGNTLEAGRDDGGKGEMTPDYALVLRALSHSVVANNSMARGAIKELTVDLGGHGEGFILKDNPGSLIKPSA